MNTQASVPDGTPVIHADAVDFAEQVCVAMTFLSSLGVVPQIVHLGTDDSDGRYGSGHRPGQVEVRVDGAGFDRAGTRLVVDFGGTRHAEGEFLYVEGRVDGVPVQVWTTVEERDGHESAQVEASLAREDAWFAGPIGGASL